MSSPQLFPRRIPYGMKAAYTWQHADARDVAGSNDGTLNGGATVLEGVASCLSAGDFVDLGLAPDTLSKTITYWVKPQAATFYHFSAVDGAAPSSLGLGVLHNTDGTISAGHNGNFSVAAGVTSVPLNSWTFIAVTFAAPRTVEVFINGASDGSGTEAKDFTVDGANRYRISGRWATVNSGSAVQAASEFGECRIYDRVLTDQEISDIYRNTVRDYIPAATTTGLEAWYRWYGNANDVTGNSNDGTLTNGAAASAGVLTLDGVNDFVTIPDSASLDFSGGVGVTLCAWIKMTDATKFRVMAKIADNSNLDFNFSLNATDNLTCAFYDQTASDSVSAAATGTLTSSEGSWIHVAVTFDGVDQSGITLYVGGASVGITTGTGGTFTGIQNTASPLDIGRVVTIPDYANGLFGECRVYSAELTAQQISDLYQNTRSQYP